MDIREELKSGGAYPSGPASAIPWERNEELIRLATQSRGKKATKVSAGLGRMASGLVKTTASAIRHGKVSKEIREERYDTCKACPFFVEDSKRCSDCGCFMEAKTWVAGNPEQLCPQKKWSR